MLVVNNAGAFPAKMLCDSGIKQMCERGKIQEGAIADITILDPETVTENSDYGPGENGLPSTGIPYVLVNGKIVVRDSVVDLDVRAGQPIRYEPID
jgi:N-acyl-D-aspartate/D-glutamate deacylase